MKELSRRDFLKLSGFIAGSTALYACGPVRRFADSTNTPMRLNPEDSYGTIGKATSTPVPNTVSENQTATNMPEKEKPNLLNIFSHTFIVTFPSKTSDVLGYGKDRFYSWDIPLTAVPGEDYAIDKEFMDNDHLCTGGKYLELYLTGEKGCNKFYIFPTDRPDMIGLYGHSGLTFSWGDGVRNIGNKVARGIDLRGYEINFKFTDTNAPKELTGKIAYVNTINAEQFDGQAGYHGVWSFYDGQAPFFSTVDAGIPDTVRNSPNPKVIFMSCSPSDPKSQELITGDLGKSRTLVVVEFGE